MSKRFIAPLKVMKFSSLKTDDGKLLQMRDDEEIVGFIPVYDSILPLVEQHGTEIKTISFIEDNENE